MPGSRYVTYPVPLSVLPCLSYNYSNGKHPTARPTAPHPCAPSPPSHPLRAVRGDQAIQPPLISRRVHPGRMCREMPIYAHLAGYTFENLSCSKHLKGAPVLSRGCNPRSRLWTNDVTCRPTRRQTFRRFYRWLAARVAMRRHRMRRSGSARPDSAKFFHTPIYQKI